MSLYDDFETDNAKETEGARIELHGSENDDGTTPTFILSRMGKSNKAYSKALERETKPFRRQIELGTMSAEASNKIMLKVFVDVVLKGWENVTDKKGKVIAYSKANALKLLESLPDLYDYLQAEASQQANFRADALEDEAKN